MLRGFLLRSDLRKNSGYNLPKVQSNKNFRLHLTVNFILLSFLVLLSGSIHAGVDYTGISYRTTTVFSEGTQNRWRMGESYERAHFTTENSGLKMSLDVAHSRPDGDLRWGYDKNALSSSDIGDARNGQLSGRIFFQEQYIQSAASVSAFADMLSTSLGWRYISADRQEYSAGIRLRPLQNICVGFKRSNAYPLPSFSELFYTYRNDGRLEREGGKLNWLAPAWINEFTAELSLLESINIESVIKEYDFRPRTPETGESPSGTYLGVIDGLCYDSRISARYQTHTDWSAEITYHQSGIHNRLRMFNGGQQFAYFGVVEADVDIWSLGFNYKSWRLKFRNGHGEGRLQGVVKAWPFVDGLLQFLGERRHFIGVAKADWKLTTITEKIADSRRLHMDVLLDYLYLKPEMSYATWKPKSLFGIGIEDLKSGKLDIIRADLICLSIKPAFRYSHFIMEFDISQWLPLSVKKSKKEAETSSLSPGPPDNSDNSSGKNNIWGGFNAIVNLRVEF